MAPAVPARVYEERNQLDRKPPFAGVALRRLFGTRANVDTACLLTSPPANVLIYIAQLPTVAFVAQLLRVHSRRQYMHRVDCGRTTAALSSDAQILLINEKDTVAVEVQCASCAPPAQTSEIRPSEESCVKGKRRIAGSTQCISPKRTRIVAAHILSITSKKECGRTQPAVCVGDDRTFGCGHTEASDW